VQVEIAKLNKRFGDLDVLVNCSLTVKEGELVTLLGPSGCGKTTLLRCLAGFDLPDSGTVFVGNEDITQAPPNKRNVGLVFQSYALFPHLTVANNVGYGLTVRRVPREKRRNLVDETLALVGLQELEHRYPAQLSGGQQQRVALARALILQPKILLLDEAFNALDAKLRISMQIELRKLVKKVGITTICVTHDQIEALTISDRIAIMSEGRIDQIGNPPEIYEHPQTEFVAEFLGVANLFSRKVNNGVVQLASGLEIPTEYHGDVTVVLRPEDLCIAPEIRDKGWTGTVSYTRLLGPTIELEVVIDEQERPLRVSVARRDGSEISVGKRVNISLIDPRNTVVIPLKAKL
jgi:ABC-type Fe3+/spermidine/putrescine transport system ATPase subunit|tara:strand:+ start:1441 stop:2487 length:1047 start_codon:yes stop_codon:yes gene_type:complete